MTERSEKINQPKTKPICTVLEALIESSPVALAELLGREHLRIVDAPSYPYFNLVSTQK